MRDRPMESHVGTLMNQCRGLTRDKSRESQISDEYGEGIGGGSSVVVGKLVAASASTIQNIAPQNQHLSPKSMNNFAACICVVP